MAQAKKLQSVEIAEVVKKDRALAYWYKRGEANFAPTLPEMRESRAFEDHILQGWEPEAPFIGPETKVTLFGSCFGTMLSDHIKTLDYGPGGRTVDVVNIPITETLVTTLALRQMFEWEFEGKKPAAETLKGNRALDINFSEDLWKHTLSRLSETDVYVFLISSAEIFYDEPTGAVLWRETPGASPARQKFRMTTAEENRTDLRVIYDLIRKHRPVARMIVAVSPIPMIATYRKTSYVAANAVSKAVVRVALDEIHRDVGEEGRLFYWPLFDMVTEGIGATPYAGHYNGDRRHINDAVLDYLLRLFETWYCRVAAPSGSLFKAFVEAKVDALELPKAVLDSVVQTDRRAIQHLINFYERTDDQPVADLIARYAAEQLPAVAPDETGEWATVALGWQLLPSLERVGPAPQTVTVPATAWGYGAASEPVQAEGSRDLMLHVQLEVLSGIVGIMLIRPDGSALSERDQRLTPEDGLATVELRIYPEDGPAHILMRNYDSEGIEGSARVDGVRMRPVAAEIPKARSAP